MRWLVLGLVGAGWIAPAPLSAAFAAEPLTLEGPWSDHAVMQSGKPVPLLGTAEPGARIAIKFGTERIVATADATGRWRADLAPQRPARRRVLQIDAGQNRLRYADIAVGEVFFCSGQSNMELKVSEARDADAVLARPIEPALRLLRIDHASAVAPAASLPGAPRWEIAAPSSRRDFSAVCYFFGQSIQALRKVPVGLIEAAWGGSNIEAWVPAQRLAEAGDYAAGLKLNARYAESRAAALTEMAQTWEAWWRRAAPGTGEPWRGSATGMWQALPLPMRSWKEWNQAGLAGYDGVVWFRHAIDLTPAQAAQAATLDTGAIDEEDQTWINGEPVGNAFGWAEPRSYAVPAGRLHAGRNEIVIAVYSAWDKGGMFGPADAVRLRLADRTSILLNAWQWLKPQGNPGTPPHAPWHSIGGITGMHNAMVAPLGRVPLRAMLWYQGESNTGNAAAYEGLLDALRKGWRDQFGAAMPMLVVQLPQFGKRSAGPTESGWADLREAQRRAVAADPHSALAVTIDTGDPDNLHPADKKAVAARLVLAAGNLLYAAPHSPAGPVPNPAVRKGNDITIAFGGVTGTLRARGGPVGPFELCGSAAGTCRTVAASLTVNTVRLSVPSGVAAQRVRYCWGDAPVCALYDASGRPAGPFELTVR